MPTLTLICGIPNSGKTTYSKNFDNVVHLDSNETGYAKFLYDECLEAVRNSTSDICVEGNYRDRRHRIELVNAAKDFHKVCIWLDTPVDICKQRETRGRSDRVFDYNYTTLEKPTYDEGWDEIIIKR